MALLHNIWKSGKKPNSLHWTERYQNWQLPHPLAPKGVVIASDLSQEWLLPWFWENYHRHNTLPLSCVDLGLSPSARAFCAGKMELLPLFLPSCFVASKEEVDPKLPSLWRSTCGESLWAKREAWFKKPASCLSSPYALTLWLDLDCEVLSSLDPLFTKSTLALVDYSSTGEQSYNSGVFRFPHGHPLIATWAKRCLISTHQFGGDQDVLLDEIHTHHWEVEPLEREWNWSRTFGDNPNAKIFHWHGDVGKMVIRQSQLQNLPN